MGIFTSCCRPSATDVSTPDIEVRRRQQHEAAEKRAAQDAARGIKNADKVKRQHKLNLEMEKEEQELARAGGANLKWTAN